MKDVVRQNAVAEALTGRAVTDPFLGNVMEIAIVTGDHRKTMAELTRRGIGPWRIYTFSPENVENQTFRGRPSPFVLKVCFAQAGNMVWELMEPVSGDSIFAEFLAAHGEGLHHVAFDCNDIPYADRLAELQRRGYDLVQSGSWLGTNHFAFFEAPDGKGTCFETYVFPSDWAYPEPDGWYPPRG